MRTIIVANKWWEVSPLVSVLMHPDARPPSIENAWMEVPPGVVSPGPRLRCRAGAMAVEVWCVQDLMSPAVSAALTWEKARVLPYISTKSPGADLVIAFGTAANPGVDDANGNVVVGTRVFVHDPYTKPPDPDHHWTDARLNQVVGGGFALPAISRETVVEAEKRMLRCPNGTASPLCMSIDDQNVAVSVVNVTDPSTYATTDARALAAFKSSGSGVAASLETTHGVIRFVLDRPFMFVSGIANRVGRFDQETGPNRYSQNFAAGHNAAIALSWLLPHVASA